MVLLPPLGGRGAEEVEGVVHPAEVPLVVKPEAPPLGRPGHMGVGAGILGDQHTGGEPLLEPLVHPLEEPDGLLVLTAVFVPLPVEEPGDRVHPQPVHMVEVQPVGGGGV